MSVERFLLLVITVAAVLFGTFKAPVTAQTYTGPAPMTSATAAKFVSAGAAGNVYGLWVIKGNNLYFCSLELSHNPGCVATPADLSQLK